eukprot:700543-Pleurochrysis_carterae.AAC.1
MMAKRDETGCGEGSRVRDRSARRFDDEELWPRTRPEERGSVWVLWRRGAEVGQYARLGRVELELAAWEVCACFLWREIEELGRYGTHVAVGSAAPVFHVERQKEIGAGEEGEGGTLPFNLASEGHHP